MVFDHLKTQFWEENRNAEKGRKIEGLRSGKNTIKINIFIV